MSVDGFLARLDHTLDFLDAGGQEPHGYEEFYASVDVVVIGRKTFEVVLTFGKWFYGTYALRRHFGIVIVDGDLVVVASLIQDRLSYLSFLRRHCDRKLAAWL